MNNTEIYELLGIDQELLSLLISKQLKYENKRTGQPSILSPADEVILFFLFLRHYPVDILLGVIFNISKQSANKR